MGTKLTASHYVGGEITYTTTGNGIYNITLTVYKDCGAFTAGFPSSVTVSMLNNLTGSSVAAVTLFPGNEIALPNSYSPACVSSLPTFCISKKVYTGTLYYSGTLTNGFTFTYGNCCRNYTISNIVSPGSTSMTYKTETFPAGVGIQNSTPTFIVNPPTIVAGGIPITIPFAANDADGDSLYYEFTNALNGSITSPVTYASGYSGTTPLPSSPAATINGTTGLISANLNLQGQYVVAVAIYEYRNGLLLTKTQRDYQFNIAIVNGMSIALSNYQPIHCAGDSSGVLGVQVFNGTLPYNYSWSNGGSTAVINGIGSGTYSVVCEDALGCKDSLEVTLNEPDSLLLNISIVQASCKAVADGIINLNLTGGRAPYSYVVDAVTYPTSTITGLLAGSHQVVVRDSANLCTIDTTIIVPYDTNWNDVVVDSIFTPSCSYTADGQIQLDNTNGFNLNWLDNNSTSALRSNLNSGTYTVEVANSQGCKDSITAVVPARDSLFWNQFNTTIAACLSANNAQISFQATGGVAPYNYLLNNTTLPGTIADSLFAGTYTITLQDSVGCQIDSTVTIAADTNWNDVVVDSIFTPSCSYTADGQIQLDNTNGFNLNWLDNNSTSALRSNLNSGTYTVEVANSQGCKDSITAVVPARDSLFWNQFNTTIAACLSANNAQISFQATGGVAPYNYLLNNTTLPGTIADSLFAGTYTITLQDSVGCQIDSTVTIAADTNWYSLLLDTIISPSCFGLSDGKILFNSSGFDPNTTFGWLDKPLAGLNRDTLSAGTYTLFINNAGLCFDTLSFVVMEPDLLKIDSLFTMNTTCLTASDGEIAVFVSGGTQPYSYYVNGSAQTPPLNSFSTGTYNIEVSDTRGCSTDTTVNVGYYQNWYNIVLQNEISPLCYGDFTGEIILSTSDGNPPNVTWQWSDDPNANFSRTGLSSGTYVLTISDLSGCQDSMVVVLDEPDKIGFLPVVTEETCFGDKQGTIDLNPFGGTKPYSISWLGSSAVGSILTGTQVGTYYPTLIDNNGCVRSDTITVNGPDSLYFITNIRNPKTCSSFDGLIEMLPFGGFSPYSYYLNTTMTNAVTTGLGPGYYILEVQDSKNCSISENVSLTVIDRYALYIPNAFTPGNDNINEEFKIGGDPSCFTDVEFIIFNRWGQEVFRTEEPFTDFWNGQQSGKDSDQASFQYLFLSNERTEAGKILLIR